MVVIRDCILMNCLERCILCSSLCTSLTIHISEHVECSWLLLSTTAHTLCHVIKTPTHFPTISNSLWLVKPSLIRAFKENRMAIMACCHNLIFICPKERQKWKKWCTDSDDCTRRFFWTSRVCNGHT